MSHRLAQIESTLHRAVSQVLQTKIADPRIDGLVSITRIRVTPDLKTAFIHVSILPEKHQSKALQGLQHAAKHIHRLTREKVALATVPHFEFQLDESLKKQASVEQAIKQGLERTEAAPSADRDEQEKDPLP